MKNLLTLVLIVVVSVSVFGQDKKAIDKKLSEIQGEVKAVTIQTDKGVFTFNSEDAKYVFEKLKKSKLDKKVKVFITEDGDSEENIMVWTDKEDGSFYVNDDSLTAFNFSFENNDSLEVEKKIEVSIENGNKKVIVKTKKGDKETVEVYEGEKADDFLKQNTTKDKEIKRGKKIIIKKEK